MLEYSWVQGQETPLESGNSLPVDMASYPRRLQSSLVPPWKPQIMLCEEYLSLCIKPRQKSHRCCMRDLHHSTYYQSSLPSPSIYINQPNGLVISKSYHHSQPLNRMTTWWKGDVGRMMKREAYQYVGDMKSISTCDFLPRSHKNFLYRYSSPCTMPFLPAWFYLHVNENN